MGLKGYVEIFGMVRSSFLRVKIMKRTELNE